MAWATSLARPQTDRRDYAWAARAAPHPTLWCKYCSGVPGRLQADRGEHGLSRTAAIVHHSWVACGAAARSRWASSCHGGGWPEGLLYVYDVHVTAARRSKGQHSAMKIWRLRGRSTSWQAAAHLGLRKKAAAGGLRSPRLATHPACPRRDQVPRRMPQGTREAKGRVWSSPGVGLTRHVVGRAQGRDGSKSPKMSLRSDQHWIRHSSNRTKLS